VISGSVAVAETGGLGEKPFLKALVGPEMLAARRRALIFREIAAARAWQSPARRLRE